jgi:tRNA-modifying protein YgfZ
VSEIHQVDLGHPALLEFRGPDAVRFLNGQLTQDVRRLAGGNISLPSCVTDAKGKLQFRVRVTDTGDGALWVEGPPESSESLEARLTRYLIADDVEVQDLTGKYSLIHFTGSVFESPAGVLAREADRYGVAGTDWWIPAGQVPEFPNNVRMGEHDVLETMRISNGVPAWGLELLEGMLPPEALLEATDISYQKGCYIGQEVISRIKSAGKVNRRLTRFDFDEGVPLAAGPLENADGALVGELTSVSPLAREGRRAALGYVKRGAGGFFFRAADGALYPANTL